VARQTASHVFGRKQGGDHLAFAIIADKLGNDRHVGQIGLLVERHLDQRD